VITVVPNSAKLEATPAPAEKAPLFALHDDRTPSILDQVVLAAQFTIRGEAELRGESGDNFGVTLGFIQMFRDQSIALYRGAGPGDGSMTLTRNGAGCRDTLDLGNVLVESRGASDTGPPARLGRDSTRRFSCKLEDPPEARFLCELWNPVTKAVNYLVDLTVDFHFVDVLTIRHSSTVFGHLLHRAIRLDWRRSFDLAAIRNRTRPLVDKSTTKPGHGFAARPVRDGAPRANPHFGPSVLTGDNAPNCLIEAAKDGSELQLAIDIVGALRPGDAAAVLAGRQRITKHLMDRGRLKVN
jgi:hypothetical protein